MTNLGQKWKTPTHISKREKDSAPPRSLFTKFHGGDLNLALNPFSHTKCIYPCCCHVQPNLIRNESKSRNVKERPPERNDLVHHMEGVLPPSSLHSPHPKKPTEAHRVHPEKSVKSCMFRSNKSNLPHFCHQVVISRKCKAFLLRGKKERSLNYSPSHPWMRILAPSQNFDQVFGPI